MPFKNTPIVVIHANPTQTEPYDHGGGLQHQARDRTSPFLALVLLVLTALGSGGITIHCAL